MPGGRSGLKFIFHKVKICYSNSSFASGTAEFIAEPRGGVVGLIQRAFMSGKCSHDNPSGITTFTTCLLLSEIHCELGTDLGLKDSWRAVNLEICEWREGAEVKDSVREKILFVELSPEPHKCLTQVPV